MAKKKINRRVHANKRQADKSAREQRLDYQKRNIKNITFRLNLEQDADILNFFSGLENKVDFFRELVRREIAKTDSNE